MKMNIADEVLNTIEKRRDALSEARERILKQHERMVDTFSDYLKDLLVEYLKQNYGVFGNRIYVEIKRALNVHEKLFDWHPNFNKELYKASDEFRKMTGLNVDITFNYAFGGSTKVGAFVTISGGLSLDYIKSQISKEEQR